MSTFCSGLAPPTVSFAKLNADDLLTSSPLFDFHFWPYLIAHYSIIFKRSDKIRKETVTFNAFLQGNNNHSAVIGGTCGE